MIPVIHKATFLEMSEEKVKYWSCTNYYACVIFTQPVKTVLSNRNDAIKVVLSIAKKNEDNASSFRSLSPLGLF